MKDMTKLNSKSIYFLLIYQMIYIKAFNMNY